MTPDKVADDSFTKSSKGLLTLFAIGAIKIFVGVEFTSNTISIPWLPQITFGSLENIIYLYWAFLVYVAYRYSLHSEQKFNYLNALAMSENLGRSYLGKKFIIQYILGPNINYFVDLKSDDINQCHEVRIHSFTSGEDSDEYFSLLYNNSLSANQAKAVIYTERGGNLQKCIDNDELAQKWGPINAYTKPAQADRGQLDVYLFNSIRTFKIRFFLNVLTFLALIRLFRRNPMAFDVYMPLVLNLGLFYYWGLTALPY
ncbi:hypothetical protein [uncultured Vibrio sp.]|uniref:hypothetical protein n=1 Tax=uncultured Vibrio sp. TaxID=114054 RepID=UPI0025E3BBFA|nr:hypothetical protein [uncultured Vibrio sp.]